MKFLTVAFIAILIFSGSAFALQDIEATDAMFWQDKYVLILKSTTDYDEAVRFGTIAGKRLGLEFNNDNIRYSKEKGILFSEDISDKAYRGGYYPRRYAGEYASLENSSNYFCFERGYIIVVSGIYDKKEESLKALEKIKEIYSDAYVKKTAMWMGCIH